MPLGKWIIADDQTWIGYSKRVLEERMMSRGGCAEILTYYLLCFRWNGQGFRRNSWNWGTRINVIRKYSLHELWNFPGAWREFIHVVSSWCFNWPMKVPFLHELIWEMNCYARFTFYAGEYLLYNLLMRSLCASSWFAGRLLTSVKF